MSYLAMSAAPFNNDEYNKNTNYKSNEIERKRNARNQNKIIKNKQTGTSTNIRNHVNAMINQIHKSTGLDTDDDNADADDDDDKNELGNFSPPPPPESVGGQRCIDRTSPIKSDIKGYSKSDDLDTPVSLEGFDNLPSNSAEDYYKEHVPYYNNINNSSSQGRDELLEKLNYMIHLLEEQQDEKTGHITEEIILYSFLGIFIIFIVDSFARAGKYVR